MLTEWVGTQKNAFNFMPKGYYNINSLLVLDTFSCGTFNVLLLCHVPVQSEGLPSDGESMLVCNVQVLESSGL